MDLPLTATASPESMGSATLWIGFNLFVLGMLALDLGLFHRKAHAVGMREAFGWSVFWISLALVFNACIYAFEPLGGSDDALRHQRGLEFFTAYILEKSLSVDNLFVFLLIFRYFRVAPENQHRVLFWGILGALVMRAILIVAGVALLHHFHWLFYVFGGFLIYTGIHMLVSREEPHPEKNPVLKWFRRVVPTTHEFDGNRFFVVRDARRLATPLLAVLVLIEASDLVFAVDSIPAVLGVSSDPFVVYTSNVFAILGLRSLYFVLASVVDKFRFLKVGLAIVLAFIGVKMVIAEGVFGWAYHIPIGISLAVVGGLLGVSVILSLAIPPPPHKPGEEPHAPGLGIAGIDAQAMLEGLGAKLPLPPDGANGADPPKEGAPASPAAPPDDPPPPEPGAVPPAA